MIEFTINQNVKFGWCCNKINYPFQKNFYSKGKGGKKKKKKKKNLKKKKKKIKPYMTGAKPIR